LFFIIGLIGYFPDTRVSLYAGFGWIVLLLLGYLVKRRYAERADTLQLETEK